MRKIAKKEKKWKIRKKRGNVGIREKMEKNREVRKQECDRGMHQ